MHLVIDHKHDLCNSDIVAGLDVDFDRRVSGKPCAIFWRRDGYLRFFAVGWHAILVVIDPFDLRTLIVPARTCTWFIGKEICTIGRGFSFTIEGVAWCNIDTRVAFDPLDSFSNDARIVVVALFFSAIFEQGDKRRRDAHRPPTHVGQAHEQRTTAVTGTTYAAPSGLNNPVVKLANGVGLPKFGAGIGSTKSDLVDLPAF